MTKESGALDSGVVGDNSDSRKRTAEDGSESDSSRRKVAPNLYLEEVKSIRNNSFLFFYYTYLNPNEEKSNYFSVKCNLTTEKRSRADLTFKDLLKEGTIDEKVKKLIDVDGKGNDARGNIVSLCYFYGVGVEKNLNIAADRGCTEAQYELGKYYLKEGKSEEALKYLGRVADKGHSGAKFGLGYHYYKQNKIEEALPYIKDAAEKGDANAKYMLAGFYLEGVPSLESDLGKATELLKTLKDNNANHPRYGRFKILFNSCLGEVHKLYDKYNKITGEGRNKAIRDAETKRLQNKHRDDVLMKFYPILKEDLYGEAGIFGKNPIKEYIKVKVRDAVAEAVQNGNLSDMMELIDIYKIDPLPVPNNVSGDIYSYVHNCDKDNSFPENKIKLLTLLVSRGVAGSVAEKMSPHLLRVENSMSGSIHDILGIKLGVKLESGDDRDSQFVRDMTNEMIGFLGINPNKGAEKDYKAELEQKQFTIKTSKELEGQQKKTTKPKSDGGDSEEEVSMAIPSTVVNIANGKEEAGATGILNQYYGLQ